MYRAARAFIPLARRLQHSLYLPQVSRATAARPFDSTRLFATKKTQSPKKKKPRRLSSKQRRKRESEKQKRINAWQANQRKLQRLKNLHPAGKMKRILSRCDYWFSDTNLRDDEFMRDILKRHHGWFPLKTLLTFPKFEHWVTPELLVESFKNPAAKRYTLRYGPPPPQGSKQSKKSIGALGSLNNDVELEAECSYQEEINPAPVFDPLVEDNDEEEEDLSFEDSFESASLVDANDNELYSDTAHMDTDYHDSLPAGGGADFQDDFQEEESTQWSGEEEDEVDLLFGESTELEDEDDEEEEEASPHEEDGDDEEDISLSGKEEEGEVNRDPLNAFIRRRGVTVQSILDMENARDAFFEREMYNDFGYLYDMTLDYDDYDDDDSEGYVVNDDESLPVKETKKVKGTGTMKKYRSDRTVVVVRNPKKGLKELCKRLKEAVYDYGEGRGTDAMALGFDVEYASLELDLRSLPAMLQLASPGPRGLVGLIWLDKFPNHGRNVLNGDNMYNPLVDLLRDSKILKVGVGASQDASNLVSWWGINDKDYVDSFISCVVNIDYEVEPSESVKLESLCESVLECKLDKRKLKHKQNKKEKKKSHWRADMLTKLMERYAANDAACSVDVWLELKGERNDGKD